MADDAKDILKELQEGSLTKENSKGEESGISRVRYSRPGHHSEMNRRITRRDSSDNEMDSSGYICFEIITHQREIDAVADRKTKTNKNISKTKEKKEE